MFGCHQCSDANMKRIKGPRPIIWYNIDELCIGIWHTKFNFDWLICLETRAKSLGVQKNRYSGNKKLIFGRRLV